MLEGHRNIDDLLMVSPDYDQLLIAFARDTEFSSAWTILGLPQVLQRTVMYVYPPENGPFGKTVEILSAFGSFQHKLPLSILWMRPKKGKGKTWLPNHFVPISPESSGDGDDASGDEKHTEGGPCGGCDDDDVMIDDDDDDDDGVYDVGEEVDDDYPADDNNEIDSDTGDANDEEQTSKVTSSPVVLHDGEETESHDKTRDSDDLTGMCSEGKALPSDNFLPIDEVRDLLTSDTLETVHDSVPLGRKENACFFFFCCCFLDN